MTTPAQQSAAEHDQLRADVANLHEQQVAMAADIAAIKAGNAPDAPDVTAPPDAPTKIARNPIKNKSAQDFLVRRPVRERSSGDTEPTHGAWFVDGDYSLANGVIAEYGGVGGKWGQGIYASDLAIDGLHIYGPTRRERQSRDHPIYLSGSSLYGGTLVIGRPDDDHPHDIDLNVTRGGTGPQVIDLDVLVVFGGHRQIIEADEGSLAKLRIGKLLVVDPVGADGRWEGIEIKGCPDIEIGEYVVIDTASRITKLALIDADDCDGSIGRAAVYAPVADKSRKIISGVGGWTTFLATPPNLPQPTGYGPEYADAWLAWAGVAA